MPEEHEHVVEAAEHAAEVLEHGDRKQSQLPSLLLAGAAFLASLGAFLKTFDHSTAEGTYKTTSDLIVKLSERQEKTDQQVAAIRGYLDGLSHTPILGTVSPAPAASETPAPMATHHPAPPPHVPVPVPTSLVSATHADAGVITFVIPPSTSALPPPMPPAAPVKPPPFDVARSHL